MTALDTISAQQKKSCFSNKRFAIMRCLLIIMLTNGDQLAAMFWEEYSTLVNRCDSDDATVVLIGRWPLASSSEPHATGKSCCKQSLIIAFTIPTC